MANIMREENGGDLTYFLEYYLELLSRAVDERRLRMSKKEEENRVAEQEMAHTPLSAPIATTGRDPEPTVGEVREEEENPTAVGSPESAPEWQELIGTDPPTLPREEQNKSNVERLQEYAEDPETHIGQGANLLLHWLSIGKTTFTCNDIDTALNVNYFKGGSLIAWLKEKGLIELLVNKSKGKVYRIITGDDSPQPQYVECNTACEFLGAKIPVYEAPSPKRTRDDYAPEILEKISSLARSTKSTKDKRLAAMLTSCLEKGEVTLQDYADIGEESKLYTDMLFALQLGIVEKENARCYRILTEVKDGPPALSKSQKRIITEMYALIEMYLAGVSVRRVEDITEALWGTKVSPSTISELNKKAYVHIEDWRNRPLQGGKYPYVYVDGIYLRRNWGGEYENVAILVAIAVNEDGYREVLGAAEGMKEDKASWVSFFQWLKGRGLDGVKLIVGDKCLGMLEAVGEVFPDAKYQRCTVHFYRNVFSVVPRSKIKLVAKMLKAIHAQESKKAAREKAKAVVAELKDMKLKEAAKKVEDGIEETLTYCDFPSEHWTRIRTNNVIERLNREIRRRTRVVGCFPDGNSALMLVCARLRHVAGTQWGNKKYMNMKHLETALEDASIAG